MQNRFFCPNKDCSNHIESKSNSKDIWYTNHSSFTKKSGEIIPRFKCKKCGKTFSVSTFSINYYAHHDIDYKELQHLIINNWSIKNIAKHFNVSKGCIKNRIERLGRQVIAFSNKIAQDKALKVNNTCSDKPIEYNTTIGNNSLEEHLVVLSKKCSLERNFISENVNINHNITNKTIQKEFLNLYSYRYILSFLKVSALQRFVWGQEYKQRIMSWEYIPKFLTS